MSGIIGGAGSKSGVIGTTELDYEEGVWVPYFTSGGGSFGTINYAGRDGSYVRIGNLVHVAGEFYTTSVTVSTASGSVYIAGLPFPISSGGTNEAFYLKGDIRLYADDTPIAAEGADGGQIVQLFYRSVVYSAAAALVPADLGTGTNNVIGITGSYRTS